MGSVMLTMVVDMIDLLMLVMSASKYISVLI